MIAALIWTAASVTAFLVSAWSLRQAWFVLRDMGPERNGRRILNRGWVRRMAIWTLVFADWVVVGGMASLGIQSPLLAPLLIGSAIVLAVSAVLDALERMEIERILDG